MIGGEVWVWITSTIISRTFDLSLNCLFVWASTRINLHAGAPPLKNAANQELRESFLPNPYIPA